MIKFSIYTKVIIYTTILVFSIKPAMVCQEAITSNEPLGVNIEENIAVSPTKSLFADKTAADNFSSGINISTLAPVKSVYTGIASYSSSGRNVNNAREEKLYMEEKLCDKRNIQHDLHDERNNEVLAYLNIPENKHYPSFYKQTDSVRYERDSVMLSKAEKISSGFKEKTIDSIIPQHNTEDSADSIISLDLLKENSNSEVDINTISRSKPEVSISEEKTITCEDVDDVIDDSAAEKSIAEKPLINYTKPVSNTENSKSILDNTDITYENIIKANTISKPEIEASIKDSGITEADTLFEPSEQVIESIFSVPDIGGVEDIAYNTISTDENTEAINIQNVDLVIDEIKLQVQDSAVVEDLGVAMVDQAGIDYDPVEPIEIDLVNDPIDINYQESGPMQIEQGSNQEQDDSIINVGSSTVDLTIGGGVGTPTIDDAGDVGVPTVDDTRYDIDDDVQLIEEELWTVGISTGMDPSAKPEKESHGVEIIYDLVLGEFIVRTDERIIIENYIEELNVWGFVKIEEIYLPEIYKRTGKYIYKLSFNADKVHSYIRKVIFKQHNAKMDKYDKDFIVNYYIKKKIDNISGWDSEWIFKFFQDSVVIYKGPDKYVPIDPVVKPEIDIPEKPDKGTDDNYKQWHINYINVPEAWDLMGYDSLSVYNGPEIAVLDTGIDYKNEYLENNIADRDYVLMSSGTDNKDCEGHGTHVASIIGAERNESTSISGIVPNASIYPVKVLKSASGEADSFSTSVDICSAIIDVVVKGASIINLSLGVDGVNVISEEPWLLQQVIDWAWDNGVLIIASAGNINGNADLHMPANLNHVFSVTSIDQKGQLWIDDKNDSMGANIGASVAIAAPGRDIIGYGLDEILMSTSGTSTSCAIASGVAGLIKFTYPDATPEEIALRIINSGDTKITDTDIGIINALDAVSGTFSLEDISQRLVVSNIEIEKVVGKSVYSTAKVNPGDRISFKVYIKNLGRSVENEICGMLTLTSKDIDSASIINDKSIYPNFPFLCNVANDLPYEIIINDNLKKDKIQFVLTLRDRTDYNTVIDRLYFEIEVEP